MAVFLDEYVMLTAPTNPGVWTDTSVASYVPVGATGVILRSMNSGESTVFIGLRKKGSSDTTTFAIPPTITRGWFVGLDSNRTFQWWRAGSLNLYIYGYFTTDAVFFNDPIEYQPSLQGQYETFTLSGIGEKALGAILNVQAGDRAYRGIYGHTAQRAWIRKKGSSYDQYDNHDFGNEFGGSNPAGWENFCGIWPVNDQKQIEVKCTHKKHFKFQCIGYLRSGIEFFDPYIEKTGNFSDWLDFSVEDDITGDKNKATGVLMADFGDWYLGLRKNNEYYDDYGLAAEDIAFFGLPFEASTFLMEGHSGEGTHTFYLAGIFYQPDPNVGNSDQAEERTLDIAFDDLDPDSTVYLGLYKNENAFGDPVVLSDIDEVSGTNYQRIALSRGDWTVTGDHADHAQITFTAGSDWGDVYGWFLATSSDDSGKLLQSEHFSLGPYPMANGAILKFNPRVVCA